MYFGSYEVLQRMLTPANQSRSDLGPMRTLLAGGVAGMLNWAVAIAPDVLKSRLQTGESAGTAADVFTLLYSHKLAGYML